MNTKFSIGDTVTIWGININGRVIGVLRLENDEMRYLVRYTAERVPVEHYWREDELRHPVVAVKCA